LNGFGISKWQSIFGKLIVDLQVVFIWFLEQLALFTSVFSAAE
jgi:hypothetical protein